MAAKADKTLSATLDVSGFDEAGAATTELGKAVSAMEPLAEKIGKTLDLLSSGMARFTAHIEQEVSTAEAQAEKELARKVKAEEKSAKNKKDSEDARLKNSMARLIGGGVNAVAYEQQLTKLEEQEKMIRAAEERRLISHRDAMSAVIKLKVEHAKLNLEAKAYTAAGGGTLGKLAAGIAHKTTALPGQAVGAIKNQVGGIGTGMMGLAASLPIAGGLFGLLMYGITNRDRINAETGEIINIAVAASGKLSSSGSAFLGSFQQQAEHYFGINRQEVQSVLKVFVDAGMDINKVLSTQSGTLGLVGHDIMTLTLGIDKHFEMASGTSAQAVVSLVQDFNVSLDNAGSMYTKLAFAGSRSGMGTQNFINTVMQGAGALKQYGVSVENVAGVLVKLQERYESMGMPKQLAGQQASMSMSQITQGMGGMSSSMQAYFGERMGMGHGLEARMKFRDGMERIGGGNADNQFMGDFVGQAYKSSMEAAGGDKTQARYMLEQQGFGFEGAKGIMEIGDKLASGVKLNELSLKEQKNLRDAFKTEGQKQSEIEKNKHTLMQGLGEIGEGVLQVVTNLVAYSILFYKSLPTLIMGSDAEKKAMWEMSNKFFESAGKGFEKMIAGSKTGLVGMKGLLGPILDPMIKAIRWSPKVDKQYSDLQGWNFAAAKNKAADEMANKMPGMGGVADAKRVGSQMQTSQSGFVRGLGEGIEGAMTMLQGFTRSTIQAVSSDSSDSELEQRARTIQAGMVAPGEHAPPPSVGAWTGQSQSAPETKTVTVAIRPSTPSRPTTIGH